MTSDGHHERASVALPAGLRRPSRLAGAITDPIIATARSVPTIAAAASPDVWTGRSTPAT
jgi:hypothetical protein